MWQVDWEYEVIDNAHYGGACKIGTFTLFLPQHIHAMDVICNICSYDLVSEEQDIVSIPCGHVFHRDWYCLIHNVHIKTKLTIPAVW